ncbi:unnamed protein product [Strongylus vulgaris]|uniref:Carbohydrate kinase FGGY N-terminal domain-containing protein n=1 Tax=Strongylus vulgaris TaxID=40348 RepID=A0A3P7LT60_STRVU|nr:unnamed protein product [Strongylus vulgaris]
MTTADEDLFLGVDLSTQQLKGIVLNGNDKVILRHGVNFSKDLPEFGTTDGILKQTDGSIVSPVLMWVKAFDLLLKQIQSQVAMENIRCIGGCAQVDLLSRESKAACFLYQIGVLVDRQCAE